MYKCIIESNSSSPREYDVDTRSAMTAAQRLGRAEGGETVTITNKSGRVLSRVVWSPESGGKYIRVTF